jgi:glycosyltransferase involved in cell wall biosynthesis
MFTKSVADLAAICSANGLDLRSYFLFNESLITRARNYCVDEFMRSDCTHMMFIDSDIGFDPRDIIAMMALQSEESEYDVLAGPYPKKTISWEKIKMAVDKGIADEDPTVLEKFVGDYVFNPKANTTQVRIDEPVEVSEVGTGFMMTRRSAFERFAKAYPEYSYRPDHVRTEHFDGSREIMQYFQAEIDPVSKRYLSEDYWFCQKLMAAGGKIWYCPWMKLQHVGSYIFGGSLADLASIGAPATADPSQLRKGKK